MSITAIALGTAPDGAGGDNNREAFTKVNANEAFLNAVSRNVTGAATLANTDANDILLCAGTFDVTLPDSLEDDVIVMVLVTSGVVTIVTSGTAALEGGSFSLDASDGIAVATLLHTTGGQWYALWSAPAAPKAEVVASGASLTLDATHDGAIIEVADGATVTTGGSLPAGWSCSLVRVGATSATIARGTGHTLYGPGGDAASFTIDNQWEAAALYARGSDAFVLLGPVT